MQISGISNEWRHIPVISKECQNLKCNNVRLKFLCLKKKKIVVVVCTGVI